MQTDRLFRALANQRRRDILEFLMQGGSKSQIQIADALSMERQVLSHHVKLLEKADLITSRWNGREKLHSLRVAPLEQMQRLWLAPFLKISLAETSEAAS